MTNDRLGLMSHTLSLSMPLRATINQALHPQTKNKEISFISLAHTNNYVLLQLLRTTPDEALNVGSRVGISDILKRRCNYVLSATTETSQLSSTAIKQCSDVHG